MAEPGDGTSRYEVHASGLIRSAIRRIYARMSSIGKGKEVISAFRALLGRLSHDPYEVGEPLYGFGRSRSDSIEHAIDVLQCGRRATNDIRFGEQQ